MYIKSLKECPSCYKHLMNANYFYYLKALLQQQFFPTAIENYLNFDAKTGCFDFRGSQLLDNI